MGQRESFLRPLGDVLLTMEPPKEMEMSSATSEHQLLRPAATRKQLATGSDAIQVEVFLSPPLPFFPDKKTSPSFHFSTLWLLPLGNSPPPPCAFLVRRKEEKTSLRLSFIGATHTGVYCESTHTFSSSSPATKAGHIFPRQKIFWLPAKQPRTEAGRTPTRNLFTFSVIDSFYLSRDEWWPISADEQAKQKQIEANETPNARGKSTPPIIFTRTMPTTWGSRAIFQKKTRNRRKSAMFGFLRWRKSGRCVMNGSRPEQPLITQMSTDRKREAGCNSRKRWKWHVQWAWTSIDSSRQLTNESRLIWIGQMKRNAPFASL